MSNKRRVTEIEGTVVLRKAAFLDVKDFTANAVDRFSEFMERKVLFQLASSEKIDNETGYGKVSPHKAELSWNTPSSEAIVTDTIHEITFYWPPEYGTPGAIVVKNRHAREFFLKHVSIRVPGQGVINFLCNSWVYPSWMARVCCNLQAERVFFANNSYLPEETSKGLRKWRREKLSILKGDGTGKREKWDRIYDYDVYNDLGDPDNDQRTTLGGSLDFPYPRRCRTGRNRIRINGMLGSILPESFSSGFYIPADQRLPHASRSDFLAHSLKALGRKYVTDSKLLKEDFGDLEEVKRLYSRGLSSTTDRTISLVKEAVPFQIVKRILDTEDQAILRFPRPNIISRDDNAWMKDEEFARQTLSGVNPMMIERVRRFPIFSILNAQIYGPQKSSINAQHLHPYLDGFSVEEAIKLKKLFILNYHDAYIPYVERINNLPTSKVYATRTIFFLLSDGTLDPIAIELCLPPISKRPCERRVFTPDYDGEDEGWLWQLAKAHVRSNDSCYHQIVSHWLRTHAVVEPFIIATNRNLSKLHPLHKLLVPHFRNTMEINRQAREKLINAGGIMEQCFSPGQYAMEMSAKAYVGWRFNEQGLPADLLKRGMAVPDPTNKVNGLKLVVEDYPYAVDGLEIWDALKSWVSDYISLYYCSDQAVEDDEEVQEWWEEIIEVGHEDKKDDEEGWYEMNTLSDLKEGITTIIWVASAHHAAVNFGQYGYAGFMPNNPSLTRKLVPRKGTREFSQFLDDPEACFLKTLADPVTTTTIMAVLQILSKHSTDEVYLGQGSASEWVDDPRVEKAFQQFQRKLLEIERKIKARNENPRLKNRCGAAKLPYTLLFPYTSDDSNMGGLTFRGIPNSISI